MMEIVLLENNLIYFAYRGWLVANVANKPIEEIASEILDNLKTLSSEDS